jgi:hypothetical protein
MIHTATPFCPTNAYLFYHLTGERSSKNAPQLAAAFPLFGLNFKDFFKIIDNSPLNILYFSQFH